jgi:protein involved in polysaccharide export with SLBB domain
MNQSTPSKAMETHSHELANSTPVSAAQAPVRRRLMIWMALPALALMAVLAGCQTEQYSNYTFPGMTTEGGTNTDLLTLREGDTIKIEFPGSESLNDTQLIMRDGSVSLKTVGQVKAAGLTPADLEKKLFALYTNQVAVTEVRVSLQSSVFPVYVTGAVVRPGEISSDHPLSALEAIEKAGGFDLTKANTKAVIIIRQEGAKTTHHILNLQRVLDGNDDQPFFLKPNDIVNVKERFVWF